MDQLKKAIGNQNPKHITFVGAVYIDTILTTSHYPEEDSKLRASAVQIRRGGNCANSLEILTQYGEKYETILSSPVLVSALPSKKSADYDFIRNSLPGVVLESATIAANEAAKDAPKSWIIRSETTGSRTIVSHVALQELTYDDLAKLHTVDTSKSTSWWHFEGRNVEAIAPFIKFLRASQADDTVISLEIEKPDRPGLQEIAYLCNYVFYSRSFAIQAGYERLNDFLVAQRQRLLEQQLAEHRLYVNLLFCTWGEEGSGVIPVQSEDAASEVIHVQSSVPKGRTIIDTVGAGDVFVGSMIAQIAAAQNSKDSEESHLRNAFLEHSLTEANAHCGIKICQEGFQGVRETFLDGQNSWTDNIKRKAATLISA